MSDLTVIMPVYNGEEFLEESINSILTQTFSNFKFIILNDNSKDGTAQILKDYQQKDSRIQVVTKSQNTGPANLRNEGIAMAPTECIALMDADDIALPTRFEKQYAFLKENPDYGVCGTWFTFFGDKKNKRVKHASSHEKIKVKMLSSCCIGNPTVMFKKSHLGTLRFENKYVPAEDYGLWSQMASKTKFYNIPESLLNYRWHPNNISQTKQENLIKSDRIVKKKQLINFGIAMDNANIDSYLNAVNFKKGLTIEVVKKTIEAAKELKKINAKSNFYNQLIFSKHIDKIITRTLRNTKENNWSYFKYLKNESSYFSKLPAIDKCVLFFKCLF